jgi:sulfhydrogenase subunit beta (sulfur reductase)
MARIIYKQHLNEFAESLMSYGNVYAPILKHHRSGASKHTFEKYTKGLEIVPNYPVTVLPPKQFLLPAEDVLFEFSKGEVQKAKTQTQVLFGLSYADLEGISKLKRIFNSPDQDEPFNDKAQKTIVIAIDRFSPPTNIDFDIYLQQISLHRFAAFAGSPRGQRILKNDYFKSEKIRVPRVTRKADPLLENKILAQALEKSRGGLVWEELSERCFACGICSFVCPLCYCFETEDKTSLPATEPPSGQRVRHWSSCFSADFAQTSAHNFRPNRSDRIYNWYFHKFVRMPEEYGFSGCIDCGRCISLCPAKINYRAVLTQVLKEYGEETK